MIVNLPDEYYAQGYGAGYEAYTQVHYGLGWVSGVWVVVVLT